MNKVIRDILLNSTKYGVFILRNDKFLYLNQQFANFFGYSRDELITSELDNLFQSKEKMISKLLQFDFGFSKIIVNGIKKDHSLVEIEFKHLEKIDSYKSTIIIGIVTAVGEENYINNVNENTDLILIKNNIGEVIDSNHFMNNRFDKLQVNNNIFNWYETDDLVWKLGIVKYKRKIDISDSNNKNYEITKLPLYNSETGNYEIMIIGIENNETNSTELSYNTYINFEDINISIDSNSAITILDKDFTYRYVNVNFCNIIGLSKQQLLGESFFNINFGISDNISSHNIKRIVKDGKTWRGDIISKDREGINRIANITIIPVLDSNGTSHQYIVIRNDNNLDKQLVLNNNVNNSYYENQQNLSLNSYLQNCINTVKKDNIIALLMIELEQVCLLRNIYGIDMSKTLIENIRTKLMNLCRKEIYIQQISDSKISLVIKDFNNIAD